MVAQRAYIPSKSDIVWLNFNPIRGHEQGGRRPAFIVSSRIYNAKSGLALACPITSQMKGYPFEVAFHMKTIQGVILADQIRGIDWRARMVEKVGTASAATLSEVQEFLHKLISE